MNKALKTSVRPVSTRDHGIVAATALQTRMKRLFTEGFTAIDIAQPLLSFDVEKNTDDVRRIMGENNILIAGARLNGVIAGYLLREALSGSDCASHLHSFDDSQTLNETAPFADVINALIDHEYCFISLLGTVGAVITRDDLQKPPVRMWLFGMITIIEMFLGRTIEILYPNEAWRQELSKGRLKKALQVLEERKRRNQSPRLLDCLQLSDKAQILIKDPVMREDAGFTSKREGERVIRELESLRNSLAHAQDIVTHDWNAVVTIANRLEKIMTRI